jgi:hypothetical protein
MAALATSVLFFFFLEKFDYFSTKKLGNFCFSNVHLTNSASFLGQNLPNFLYEKKKIVGHQVQFHHFLSIHASL